MRAELLGLPRPTLQEYEASKSAIRSANYDEDELEELRRKEEDRVQVQPSPPEADLVEVQLTVSRPPLSASSRVGVSPQKWLGEPF